MRQCATPTARWTASAVHPEAYPLVKRIALDTERDIRSLIGDASFLQGGPLAELALPLVASTSTTYPSSSWHAAWMRWLKIA